VIENAGFEVIQAGNADEAIAILKARPDIHVVFTEYPDAGFDGWAEARPVRPGPLAADQDRCDVGSCAGRRRRFAGRERYVHQDRRANTAAISNVCRGSKGGMFAPPPG
jgi:hypothetical protein